MEDECRNNGYIELERIFEKDECTLMDFDEITKSNSDIFDQSSVEMIFSYQDEIWLFKSGPGKGVPYMELVMEELARDFGIPSAHYDLATYNNKKGVITKYFKQKNCKYLFGEDLLTEYVEDALKIFEDDFSTWENAILSHNSLEGIWRSLDYHYRNFKNHESIVWHLMSRLVDIFIFDILTHQKDRHSFNWGVVESDGKIDIQPLYDNEFAFDHRKELPPLVSESLKEDELFNFFYDDYSFEEALLQFLEVSGDRYIEKIREKLPLIQAENILSVISRVEKRIHSKIPEYVKNHILDSFSDIVLETTETIQKYQEGLKKNH